MSRGDAVEAIRRNGSGLVNRRVLRREPDESRLSESDPLVTIEHVFGPSLQEIARKWREMAEPKGEGDKPMFSREISAAPDNTLPVPGENTND